MEVHVETPLQEAVEGTDGELGWDGDDGEEDCVREAMFEKSSPVDPRRGEGGASHPMVRVLHDLDCDEDVNEEDCEADEKRHDWNAPIQPPRSLGTTQTRC